jgi:hypothetical protein
MAREVLRIAVWPDTVCSDVLTRTGYPSDSRKNLRIGKVVAYWFAGHRY